MKTGLHFSSVYHDAATGHGNHEVFTPETAVVVVTS